MQQSHSPPCCGSPDFREWAPGNSLDASESMYDCLLFHLERMFAREQSRVIPVNHGWILHWCMDSVSMHQCRIFFFSFFFWIHQFTQICPKKLFSSLCGDFVFIPQLRFWYVCMYGIFQEIFWNNIHFLWISLDAASLTRKKFAVCANNLDRVTRIEYLLGFGCELTSRECVMERKQWKHFTYLSAVTPWDIPVL